MAGRDEGAVVDSGSDRERPTRTSGDPGSPTTGRRLRWLWLVYLVFFLMGPVVYAGPAEIAWAVAGICLFLPLYVIAGRLRGWPVLWPILGMVALGLAFARWNPGSSVFFVYAAAECGRLGPPRRAAIGVGALMVVVALVALGIQAHPFFWGPAAALVFVVGVANSHEYQLAIKNQELRRSQGEVERLARIAERERIARDLHDLLGHTLSVVILKSELAGKLAERDPARAALEIREVEVVARKALAEVREAVSSIRAESFSGELDNARSVLESAGVALDADIDPVVLPAAQEGVLALALREAVTNVIRHAGASRCRVALRADEASVRLVVEDDGGGARGPEGAGLSGMRERVAGLGGAVERLVGDGTRLAIELPRSSGSPA